jgi:hypothetical protein
VQVKWLIRFTNKPFLTIGNVICADRGNDVIIGQSFEKRNSMPPIGRKPKRTIGNSEQPSDDIGIDISQHNSPPIYVPAHYTAR